MIENTVQQKRDTGDMIQMGMGQKYMADLLHLGQGQITHAGAGIDQNLMIESERGCSEVCTNTTTAT
jgi:hypothetical protein